MFVIQKTVTGNFYHIYNNQSTKVNVSDFDVVLDDVALTFIIQCKNGSNIPSQAISLSLIQVIDLSVGTSPIAFSGVDGLILLLKSISYTPYLQSLIVTTPVTVYRVGQVGVFTMTPTQFTDNFDGTGLGQSAMLGWALRNGNNGTKNQLGKFSLNKGAAPYDVIGNIGGYEDSIIVAHKHGQRSSSTTNNDAKHVKIGFTGTDTGLYQQTPDSMATNKVQVTTEEVGISGVGKNMPPYLIDVWVERVTDLVINVGQGGGGGGAVDSVNGQTGVVYIPLDYLPLAGGTMEAGADINFDNGTKISEGVVDAGTGGNKGIALTCAVGYEWKWEAGEAYLTNLSGNQIDAKQYARSVPTPTDDDTKGFYAGSEWFTLTSARYQCVDATTDDAVWQLVINTPDLQQVTDINNVTENDLIVRSPEYERKQVIIKRATDAEDTSSVFVQYDADTYVIAYAQEGQSGIGGSVYDPAGISEFTLRPGVLSTYDSACNMSLQGGDLSLNSYVAKPKISMVGVGGAVEIRTNLLTGNRLQELPDKDGTFAMLDDITGGGTVTSVGLTMPSAFMVTNSPITSSGDIAVTGAGAVSQYVRGDGTLANFPTSSGGGSSLSFYLNGSVSQGTFGGVAFKEMDRTPILGAGTDFTINANGYIQSFITDAGVPNQLEIPAGNWNFETYFSASSNGGSPSFYVELYKWDGATLSLIASSSATPENITGGTAIDLYVSALAVPQTALLATDRLAVRIYVTHSGRTITLHTEDNHLCQVITTFSTGLTALNGLTAQVQNLATGTSGTDFAINSTTATHTFNLPTASASNRGALSSADWTTFNNKQDVATLLVDSIDKAILRNNYFWFLPNIITNGSAASFGYSERISSTTFVILLNGVITRGMLAFSTTAIAGTIASMRQHNGLQLQGYECKFTRKIQFNSNVSGQRFFCGISKGNQFAIATNVEPNTLTDIVGVCQLSTSTNMHIVYNDASGVATTSDLGSSYPCNDSQYNYYISIEQTTTSYIITVERVTVATGASISTSLTTSTNIPNYATGIIQLFTFITNNATASIASYLDGGAIGSFKN